MALVYSTDAGRICPNCTQPVASCVCRARADASALTPGDGIVRVSREKQGRAGKQVTIVRGLPGDVEALAAWGKRLRTACGAGGSVKNGMVEVQGDHIDRVLALLLTEGLRVKRAGG